MAISIVVLPYYLPGRGWSFPKFRLTFSQIFKTSYFFIYTKIGISIATSPNRQITFLRLPGPDWLFPKAWLSFSLFFTKPMLYINEGVSIARLPFYPPEHRWIFSGSRLTFIKLSPKLHIIQQRHYYCRITFLPSRPQLTFPEPRLTFLTNQLSNSTKPLLLSNYLFTPLEPHLTFSGLGLTFSNFLL